MEIERWYKHNFNKEQIYKGNQVNFLRFENSTESIFNEAIPLYVYVIPEIIDIDYEHGTDREYREQILINGADIYDINRQLKNKDNLNKDFGDPNIDDKSNPGVDDVNLFSIIGGPKNGIETDFNLRFPVLGQVNKISIYGVQSGPTLRSTLDVSDKFGLKNNYKIEYIGNKSFVTKLTFVITNQKDLLNWPKYFIDSSAPVSNFTNGDVWFDTINETYNFYNNGTWNEFEEGEPVYGIKHLHKEGLFMPNKNNPTAPFFDVLETNIICYPESESKTNRGNYYWLDKKLHKNKVYNDLDSFMLLRTNPKLSGNIKIVIDEDYNLYMDSIEANDELSNSKFKKNQLSSSGSYIYDVKRYFGGLTSEILFDVYNKNSNYYTSKKQLKNQYDFYYGAGAERLDSKYYNEEFRLFAPIWLRKKVPDYFVIFKSDGPVNKDSFISNDRSKIIKKIFKSAKIIKTVDMRPGSKLGTYLRNITEDDRFKEEPLKISYEKSDLSEWNGISYKDGTLTTKGEYLYDFFKEDHTILEFEEYITDGFERNGLISPNLLNLQFNFNDHESEEYSINRYFGFYVNEIELAEIEIFSEALKENFPEQTPLPERGLDGEPYSLREFNQTNKKGVVIPVDYNDGGNINDSIIKGKLPKSESVDDKFRIFYLKDRNNNFSRIKDVIPSTMRLNDGNKYEYTNIRLYDKNKNLSLFSGIKEIKSQTEGVVLDKGHAQVVLNIYDTDNTKTPILSREAFQIEWIDDNNVEHTWKMIANSNGLQKGDWWDYPLYDYNENKHTNTFNPEGTTKQVAEALTGCINKFETNLFSAYSEDNNVYIKINGSGLSGNRYSIRRIPVNGSNIKNVRYYNILPSINLNYSLTYNGVKIINSFNNIKTIQDIDSSGNTSNVLFLSGNTITHDVWEMSFLDLYDYSNYEIEVDKITNGYVTVNIYRNESLIGTKTWNVNNFINKKQEDIIYFESEQVRIRPNIKSNYWSSPGIDEWKYEAVDFHIRQNFIGGSDYNKNRFLLNNNVLNTIDPYNWFQVQKNKYDRLKQWNVQGELIYNIPNLETPIFENGQLVGYDKLNENSIIQLDNNNQFYKTDDNKIVSFNSFKPSLGLFSFMYIKDFDFDTIFSDYAYTPTAELISKHENITPDENGEINLELNQSYNILNGTGVLYGFDSTINEWVKIEDILNVPFNYTSSTGGIKDFNTFLPTYKLELDRDDSNTINTSNLNDPGPQKQNYYYKNYRLVSELENITALKLVDINNKLTIRKSAYIEDVEFDNFNGFLGLSDFITLNDESEISKLIAEGSIERFFYEKLISEYDRLKENFIKNYAVKSRVVPYINKWSQQGTDVRGNKYRLNLSMAFGINGFTPDTNIKDIDARLHTHEYFLLDKFPGDYDKNLYENSRGYMFDSLFKNINVIDKSWYELIKNNIDNDWFSKYFSVGRPTEYVNSNISNLKTQERYIHLKYNNGLDASEGMFQGMKFNIYELDKDNNEKILESTKYDKYKFSSVLSIRSSTENTSLSNYQIEFIVNDVYKTITMFIILYIDDYKFKDGYGFADIYTTNNSIRNINTYNSYFYENYIKNYSASNIPDNYYLDYYTYPHYNMFNGSLISDIADIKLSGVFDFDNPNFNVFPAVDNKDVEFNPENEIKSIVSDYNLQESYNESLPYIFTLEDGDFSEISQYYKNNGGIINIQADKNKSLETTPFDVTARTTTTSPNMYYTLEYINTPTTFPTSQIQTTPPLWSMNENVEAWYLGGGIGILKDILKDVSFASIFEDINTKTGNVFFYELTENGLSEGNYNFRFIDTDRIDKNNRLLVIEDDDKPSVYNNKDVIGYDIYDETLVQEETDSGKIIITKHPEYGTRETLFRHRGKFEPHTRNIINYWLREDEIMTNHYDIDFMLSNTRFNVEREEFGIIQNLFYNKVADNSLSKLGSDSAYKSEYPFVGEIQIDYKDFDIFKSNWDDKYYSEYNSLTDFNEIEGSLSLYENKSFLGSKIMNVPFSFLVETFNDDEISWEKIDSIKSTDSNNKQIQQSDYTRLAITLNIKNLLIRLLIEDGAEEEFKKLRASGITRFSNSTDEEIFKYTSEYLKLNILKLYKVNDIILYEKINTDNSEPLFNYTLNDDSKRLYGYKKISNFKSNKLDDYTYRIEKDLEEKRYKSYTISIILKN